MSNLAKAARLLANIDANPARWHEATSHLTPAEKCRAARALANVRAAHDEALVALSRLIG